MCQIEMTLLRKADGMTHVVYALAALAVLQAGVMSQLEPPPPYSCILSYSGCGTDPNQGSPPIEGIPSLEPPSPPPPIKSCPPPPIKSSPPPFATPPPPLTATSCASRFQLGKIAYAAASPVVVVLLIMGLIIYCRRRRASKPVSIKSDTGPYTFREIKTMTMNFNHSELLSSGAFGDVYRAHTSGETLLAVKRIKHDVEEGEASFVAEVNSLRQIRHRNLLQLRGWCEVKEGLFLVYDFMYNGSLDKWLHPKRQAAVYEGLSWEIRFSILSGVASGLEYLHEGWVQCVLHRDIKSSNVLLDADFNPYLGDFGLARLVDHQKLDKTTTPAGTFGYMAPEMHYSGKASKETDVYAFGILVLEVVCGRRPFTPAQEGDQEFWDCLLRDRVWRAHEAGNIAQMVDPRLVDRESTKLMSSVLQWGLLCCLPDPSARPSMKLVNHWFQYSGVGDMAPPSLPAVKPGPLGRHMTGTSFEGSRDSTNQSSYDHYSETPDSMEKAVKGECVCSDKSFSC